MEFYSKDARCYEARHDNATTRHIRGAEEALIRRHARGNALDIGCGTGYNLQLLEKNTNVASITGIDSSAEMAKIAKTNTNAKIICADCHALPFRDNEFDTIICFNTLNFLQEKAIVEMARMLKPGGTAIVSAGSIYDNDGKRHKNVRINNKRLRMKLFDKKEFVSLFEKNNFKLAEFHSLFHLQKPYWNWFRNFSLTERAKLFAENFVHYRKESGRVYFGVFRKISL